MEALKQQLEKRKKDKEEMIRKSRALEESMKQDELRRQKLAAQWKKEEEEKQERARQQQKLNEEQMRLYEQRKEELHQEAMRLEELKRLQALRVEDLKREESRQEELKKEEILRNFVDSLTPDKDGSVGTPERLISISPDSDFTFPTTIERASKVGTPASEIQVEGISTGLANRILSKTSRSVSTPSPSPVGTPTTDDGTQTPRRQLKVSPQTRLRVPKSLTKEQITYRLQEIEARRESAFESLSTKDVHLIAEEELEEKVLRRRLKKLRRRGA